MSYKIIFSKAAEKEIEKIPRMYYVAVRNKIDSLTENPRPFDCKKLKGYDNFYRVRVSQYRVIYSIQDKRLIIEVIKIGHRKDIYR